MYRYIPVQTWSPPVTRSRTGGQMMSIDGARGGASECQGENYQYVEKVSKYHHLIVSFKNITSMFRGSHQHAPKLRTMVELELELELE